MPAISIVRLVDADIFRTWKERFNLSLDAIEAITDIVNTTNTTGSVLIGKNSHIASGSNNTVVGASALTSVNGLSTKNTVVGANSGSVLTTGSSNSIFGRFTGNGVFYSSNALDIRTSSNNIVLSDGDGNVGLVVDSTGKVGIGIAPQHNLHVFGNIVATGTVSGQQGINATNLNGFSSAYFLDPMNFNSVVPTVKGGLGTESRPGAGQIPIGRIDGTYSPANLTAGNGITIQNDNGTVTISNDGVRTVNGLTGDITIAAGTPGPKGDKGDIGPQGIQGFTGPQGPAGPVGPRGPKGDTGERGLQGPKGDIGPKGDTGERGLQGPKGDKGDIGPKGDTGERGLQGPKGDTGERGLQGPKGDKGDTGLQGPKGDTGPQGLPGSNATVTLNGLIASNIFVQTISLMQLNDSYINNVLFSYGPGFAGYAWKSGRIYPPSGYTMNNFRGGIVSISQIDYIGIVNSDDSTTCGFSSSYYSDSIYVEAGNSEMRANPKINAVFFWSK